MITAAGHRHQLDNVLIYAADYDGNDGGAIERALVNHQYYFILKIFFLVDPKKTNRPKKYLIFLWLMNTTAHKKIQNIG